MRPVRSAAWHVSPVRTPRRAWLSRRDFDPGTPVAVILEALDASLLVSAELEPQTLPRFDVLAAERYPYGARSESAVFVGDLLCDEVPALSAATGGLDIVGIARRPGVLTKVAIRPRAGAVVPLVVGIGADHLARVSERLDGERIQVVRWQRSASAYIADALGLGEVPPMQLQPWIGHARVLLGEIDLRGTGGWRGYNTILASALTGWRIHLDWIAATSMWHRLSSAFLARRPVQGFVVGTTARGLRLDILGLYATLTGSSSALGIGQEVVVRITRMDPDEGRIFASDRLSGSAVAQLGLGL